MRTEPDFDSASLRQMSQFIFKQIAYCTIQQSHISVHYDMLFEFSRYFMIVLGHCGLININQLSHDIGEVDWTAIDVKRTGLRFGEIQRCVQLLQEPVEVFDRFSHGVAPLLISFIT